MPALFVWGLGVAAYAFQRPARNALTPRLVPLDQLTAAIAVEDVIFNLARVGGPAIGGLLIGGIGLAGAYAVDLGTFAASLIAIWLLPRVPAAPDADRPACARLSTASATSDASRRCSGFSSWTRTQ